MTKTTAAQAANQNAAEELTPESEGTQATYHDINQMNLDQLHTMLHVYMDGGAEGAEVLIKIDEDTKPVAIPGRDEPYRFWDEIKSAREQMKDPAFADGFRLALQMQNVVENRALSAIYHDLMDSGAQATHDLSYLDKLGTAISEFSSVLQRMSLLEHYVTKALKLDVGTPDKPGPDFQKVAFYKITYHYVHEPFMRLASAFVAARDAEQTSTRH